MKTGIGSRAALAALVTGVVLAGGCAQEREPINRVQSGAMAKSFFVGDDLGAIDDDPEFYTAATVVDVPYGTDGASVFTGLMGSLFRVKWEVTEHHLNARLTYESVDGVDGHGSKSTNNGKVLASYPILSHFDIRNAYNPSTGEELNVIEENTSDRPWYERAYFRVDWSKSDIVSSTSWDPVTDEGWDVEPLAYHVSDPNHPDAPHFATDEGYFDVTNRLYIQPKMFEMEGGRKVPACFFFGSLVAGATYPWGNCENSEITVRYSYRRVARDGEAGFSDYQPIDWDGSRMNAFGVFTRDRLGWDRNYGIVDEKWYRFAQRYNIWETSHTDRACALAETVATGCDPSRDTGDADCDGVPDAGGAPNGTDDECEDGENWGSRCDHFVGKCTLPYSKRRPKAVPWHYTVAMDDTTIVESTELATWQWDAALRTAVQTARYTECMRTGSASLLGSAWSNQSFYANGGQGASSAEALRERCASLFPIDNSHDNAELDAVRDVNQCVKNGASRAECTKGLPPNAVAAMDPMVVLCANPIAETDHPSCGKPGTVIRPGDIRYHQVNVWPTRQNGSPWGFGPSLADPLTGEIIAASINVYNSVTDSAAQSFLDQIRWINGEISVGDITSGKFVHDWVQAGHVAQGAASGPLMDRKELQRRVSGVAGVDLAKVNPASLDPHLSDLTAEMARNLDQEVLPPGVIPENRAVFEERIKRAKEKGVEADLINPMWLQMAGGDTDLPIEDQLDLASPLRGMNSHELLQVHDKLEQRLADRGQCILAAPEPTGIPALAKVMKTKFPFDATAGLAAQNARLERMWNYLRSRMNFTVILHEMGHTVGLRHNFVSSYDKYSFKPQYWQLRTNSGKTKTMCQGPVADGATCIGPRYWDPMTQDEIDNSVWTWMQSSVMDYAGDLTQDMLGLGVYDMAAARMFYADVVDVRDDVRLPPNGNPKNEAERRAAAVMSLVDYPGYLWGQAFVACPQGAGKCSTNPQSTTIGHYTAYNEAFKLVQPERCTPVTPTPPADWDESRWGVWDPLWDGEIVHNERCARPPVDYVTWSDMVPDAITVDFDDPRFFTPRRAKDVQGRPRVPYGFLTDNYADGWSPTAYRHDNGADMYEEILFHSNLYENRHIFDNFRNGRTTFSIYGAYQRALARYHAKVKNLTQGVAYTANYVLREFANNIGAKFQDVLAANLGEGGFLFDHAVAASAGFDHFVRVMTRPHVGPHYCKGKGVGCDPLDDRVLRPTQDEIGGIAGSYGPGSIPNGNMVAGGALAYGGRPLNNNFQYAHGFWTWNYLNQAGSYYEKTFAIESMLEASYGAINFFRFDGLDARFRHTNFSDLFPDGLRRFIGAALTEDARLLGARISSNAAGNPKFALPAGEKSGEKYPVDPMAWVSYVPASGPIACAPTGDVLACTDSLGAPVANSAGSGPAWFVDPQLGFEVQKFIVFWFYVYQPEEQVMDWVDLMRIYRLDSDVNPSYLPAETVEWRDPETGIRYLAKRYGDESLFGVTYDKGIAAKMIQWANSLTADVYELDPLQPYDPATGSPNVVLLGDGTPKLKGGLAKEDSPKWEQLRRYRGLLDYTRDTAARLGFPEPALQIIVP